MGGEGEEVPGNYVEILPVQCGFQSREQSANDNLARTELRNKYPELLLTLLCPFQTNWKPVDEEAN